MGEFEATRLLNRTSYAGLTNLSSSSTISITSESVFVRFQHKRRSLWECGWGWAEKPEEVTVLTR